MDDASGASASTETPKAEEPKVTGSIKIRLHRKPIQAHGEELRELTFREPTVKDIVEIGVPASWAWEVSSGVPVPRVTIDAGRMMNMMVKLGDVPPSSIAMMNPKDWANCANALADFFLPDLSDPEASTT